MDTPNKPCKACGSTERYKSGDCKACARKRASEYQRLHKETANRHKRAWANEWRKQNIDAAKAKEKVARARRDPLKRRDEQERFREANPDYWRKWQSENLDAKRDAYNRWRKTHIDVARAATRKWREANPDKVKASLQRRRARRKGAKGKHTIEQEQGRWSFYGRQCWVCNSALATQTDHVIALCNGGSDFASNLRPICSPCNGAKGQWEMSGKKTVREILDWIKARDFGIKWPGKDPAKVTP